MVVGDLATEVDVVVLGAGPGGYVAAIRAAQLGKQVVIIHEGPLGGDCLHEGCIPSKALLNAAHQAWQVPHLVRMGILADEVKIDFAQMQNWKAGIVSRLSNGVKTLLEEHEVHIVQGKGWFIQPNNIRVQQKYGAGRFIFEECILAVGATPISLPAWPFDDERVLTPAQALRLSELPNDIAIVGSDYIAAELATLFAKLGVVVRFLIPAGERLLNEFDPVVERLVQTNLRQLGVKIKRNVKDLATNPILQHAEKVIVSVGVKPRTEGLQLDIPAVKTDEQGRILVNEQMQSSNPTIYAVGDVTGGPPYAALAIKQAKVAAEAIAGLPVAYAPQAVPRVAWTDPEVASVGLTAQQAQELGYQTITGRFSLATNAHALTLNAPLSIVLTVAEERSQVLLGVTIIAPYASQLIGEAALAIEMGATLIDLAETLHPYPGLGQALQESAEVALGKVIHVSPITT